MERILVLYFSGVGNTRRVAERIALRLREGGAETELHSIEEGMRFDPCRFQAAVIGFPVYHAQAARPMREFVAGWNRSEKPVPLFLFSTCGLYPANSLRKFALECREKNVFPILSRSYRCAATDGMLLAPWMKFWFRNEKKLEDKIQGDCSVFLKRLREGSKERLPRLRLSGIVNAPNAWFGRKFPTKIYLHRQQCARCGKCERNCPENAFTADSNAFPIWKGARCIRCYRCIHHCPKHALSLFRKRTPKKTVKSTQTE